jgi:ABC-type oligopeptide transport system substrate-binding subunit
MRIRHTIAAVTITALALAACSSNDSSSEQPAPDYKVVEQDDSGNQRQITVEVNTTKNLRAVFDNVTKDLNDDAGYFVWINCSTGGTKSVDNRLANGKYAHGNIGAAATGLEDGGTEFSTNKGRSCPAKN